MSHRFFIGKLFVANRPRLVNRAFTIKIKADGLAGHFFNVITVVDFVIEHKFGKVIGKI